jgi:endonuclease YncB( thermonuclease family)
MRWSGYIALFCLLAGGGVAVGQSVIVGDVIEVPDGDDIKLVTASNVPYRVRLAGIDAPQMGQAYAEEAKKALSGKVLHRSVQVEVGNHDGYRRVVGELYLGTRWINLEMIAAGLAWRIAGSSSDEQITKAEETAREAKVGLWLEAYQLPPWEYRRWKLDTAYGPPPTPSGRGAKKKGGGPPKRR